VRQGKIRALNKGGVGALSTTTLIELVDASDNEARSIYLEGSLGGPRSLYRADRSMESSRRIFHRDVWKNSNTPVAGDPNEGSGLSNRCC